jgi:hypothetical protein
MVPNHTASKIENPIFGTRFFPDPKKVPMLFEVGQK